MHALRPERTLKGVFVSREADAVAIALKSGTGETVARQDVRKLTARRETYDRAPLTFAVAVGANKQRLDFTDTAVAMSALIGAGIERSLGWRFAPAGGTR